MNFVFRSAGWSLSWCFFHFSHHSYRAHTHTPWRPLSTCKVQVGLSYRSVYCLWNHSADLWRCHSAAPDYSSPFSALSSRPLYHSATTLQCFCINVLYVSPPGDLSLAISCCLLQSQGESFRMDDLWFCAIAASQDWIFMFPGALCWNHSFQGSFAFASGFTQLDEHRCKLLVTLARVLGCHMKPS